MLQLRSRIDLGVCSRGAPLLCCAALPGQRPAWGDLKPMLIALAHDMQNARPPCVLRAAAGAAIGWEYARVVPPAVWCGTGRGPCTGMHKPTHNLTNGTHAAPRAGPAPLRRLPCACVRHRHRARIELQL